MWIQPLRPICPDTVASFLQSALKKRKASVDLMGRSVEMDFNAGIFVTLNPAGKGYGGRSKLPDNLKALFRSVAMAVPDNEIIAEVLLLAEGFSEAKVLGRSVPDAVHVARQLPSLQSGQCLGCCLPSERIAFCSAQATRDARATGVVEPRLT